MRMQLGFGPLTAFASLSSAHSIFTTLLINDVAQGDGTCVRMPKDSNTATDPIASITGQDMACGRDGQNAVAFTCPAPAGAKLTFEWRLTPDLSSPGSIDKSHQGPCAVYLKAVSDMATDAAAGGGWFKIFEEGYDESSKQYCTDKLIANNGLQSITLPEGLPTGYYLVRTELLALQNVQASDPQFYVGCAQLFVQGGTSAPLNVPTDRMVAIPGYVKPGEPAVTFDIYASKLSLPLPIPGPQIFIPPAPGLTVADASAKQQTQGVIPDNCLVKNANWCGTEVPDYTTEAGCWASSDDCYRQLKACYDHAPPSGNKGCVAWEAKCTSLQSACSSGKFTGPPNKGQKLTAQVDAALPGAIPPASKAEGASVPAVSESGVVQPSTASSSTTEVAASSASAPVAVAPSSKASIPDSTTPTEAPAASQASSHDGNRQHENADNGEHKDEDEEGDDDESGGGDDHDDDDDDDDEVDEDDEDEHTGFNGCPANTRESRSLLGRQEDEEGDDVGPEPQDSPESSQDSSPEDEDDETDFDEASSILSERRHMRWGKRA